MSHVVQEGPKLLLSVRDAAEAGLAVAAGADLIDVKEPRRGSLGAADPVVIAEIVAAVAGRLPMSAALGELSENWKMPPAALAGVSYAKFGLAGCARNPVWQADWAAALRTLPAGILPVAVCYADFAVAESPDPQHVLSLAARYGCAAVLVDTFDKTGGSLFAHWSQEELTAYVAAIHAAGMMAVVGGSLRIDQVAEAAASGADYTAIRGAACVGDRTGIMKAELVRRLVVELASDRKPPPRHDRSPSTTFSKI